MGRVLVSDEATLKDSLLSELGELVQNMLTETDWTQSPDVLMPAVKKGSYAVYREILRKLPNLLKDVPYADLVKVKLPDPPDDVPLFTLARFVYPTAMSYLAEGTLHAPLGTGGETPRAWLDIVKDAALWWVRQQGKFLFKLYDDMIKETEAAEANGDVPPYGYSSTDLKNMLAAGQGNYSSAISSINAATDVDSINTLFFSFVPDPMKNWMVTEVWKPFPSTPPWPL